MGCGSPPGPLEPASSAEIVATLGVLAPEDDGSAGVCLLIIRRVRLNRRGGSGAGSTTGADAGWDPAGGGEGNSGGSEGRVLRITSGATDALAGAVAQ